MKLPQSHADITIRQYIDLLDSEISEDEQDEMKILNATIRKLEILTGLKREDILKLTQDEVVEIFKGLTWLSKMPTDMKGLIFYCDGRRFRVEPNANKLSGGQYMSAMQLLKQLDKDEHTVRRNIHLLIANICVEETYKWSKLKWVKADSHIVEVAELFLEKLTMDIVNPIAVFFCKLSKLLTPIIKDYSIRKANKILKEVEADLKNGDGL